jgi:phosphohistidine swiveling domain-containing protein
MGRWPMVSPTPMRRLCCCQVITFSLEATAEARPHTLRVGTREEGPTMRSATLGMRAMLPVVVGVAGYAMVSR